MAGKNSDCTAVWRLTQEICNHSIEHFSETVNVAPLFSANVAIRASRTDRTGLCEQVSQHPTNMASIERAAVGTRWTIVKTDNSLRSGIVLLTSSSLATRNMGCDTLRTQFREHGVAISAYSQGLIQVSVLAEAITDRQIDALAGASLSRVRNPYRCCHLVRDDTFLIRAVNGSTDARKLGKLVYFEPWPLQRNLRAGDC